MSTSSATAQLAALIITALTARSIYRLFLGPLSKFPGPKIAALTSLYEAYYDCYKDGGGRYYIEINRMHDEYGPIVRINPWELHIRDPNWNEVYKVARRAHKPLWYYRFLGPPDNAFSSVCAESHRRRREAINPYFSPAAIARHQPEVERLLRGTEKVVRLDDAFRALATDGATGFAFRKPFGHLDSPDFEHAGNRALRMLGWLGVVNRHLRGVVLWGFKTLMPQWLALKINPGSLGVRGFYTTSLGLSEGCAEKGEAETDLVRQILNSNLPPHEKTLAFITRESCAVALAGTESTGSVLSVTVYHLLSHPERTARLRAEVKVAYEKYGQPPTFQELRELPYLGGVVNEGLRLDSIAGRLPRLDPKNDLVYEGLVIPKGTYISTTQKDTHFCADIFSDPHDFRPERWLDVAERKRLSRYLAPFGRGARSCIGTEIALMEIYLCLGRLFSPEAGFELELHDIDFEQDVHFFHDFFSPFPMSTRGIRAFVRWEKGGVNECY
ncbi:cytochrome P450 CYP682H1 [Immersiella caudata]|uniref:Cytochrome P450 CYP682H1 n=1 Tax=Immersiella caudata TaxID=314043 RepID=A0AA39WBZ1_9PEZI|nr:cytochrome P450 CYP682H1 [Immersiella caudata]